MLAKNLSKSCQKVVKSCQKIVKKLPKFPKLSRIGCESKIVDHVYFSIKSGVGGQKVFPRPSAKRTMAIANFPVPTDLTTLRGFLGLVNQLGHSLPDLAHLRVDLRQLLKKDVDFMFYVLCGLDHTHTKSCLEGAFRADALGVLAYI
jgi:hypothetical protein